MGCGYSRLDGYSMVFPSKFHTIKTFHYARPLKKELLLQDHVVEDEKCSSLVKNVPNIPMPASSPIEKVNHEEHEEKRMEGVIKTNDDEAEKDGGDRTDDDDDDEDDERKIGHVDDEAFRGSPSFRVYFKDDGEDEKRNENDDDRDSPSMGDEKMNVSKCAGHENDASISSDEAKSSKAECCGDKKVMKKTGKKKKSSKNYKGVKNLLNYKSCYNTPSSSHNHANLIPTGKTSA